MAAGGVSVSVGTPIDLIKIRLQTQTDVKKVIKPSNVILPLSHTLNVRGSSTRALATSAVVSSTVSQAKLYAGPIECAGDIYRQHGLKGLYRGGAAMLMRDIPGYALYFIPYELIRAILTPENGRPGVASALLAGGLAGTLSWGLMNPMDTIKSRLQADIGVKTQKYEGVIHCLRSSYKSEGYSVLFRGMGMNALRGFPQSAALFFGYETAVSSILRLRGQ
uniref:Solute carrier family 25 member 48 n=1 Tax=Ciona savignyi TaxID=51511 RepID=H2ZQA8_CIOSA